MQSRQSPISSRKRSTTIVRSDGTTPVAATEPIPELGFVQGFTEDAGKLAVGKSDARFLRHARMGPEFELRFPALAREDDRQFGEVAGQARSEADVFAKLLGVVGEARASQPRFKRTAQPSARTAHDSVRNSLLFDGQVREVERCEAWHVGIAPWEG